MERLEKCGVLSPRFSHEIAASRLGLGMEKLDRDAFDPRKVYDKVAALGVKWIRLQSGWQKTEKSPGVYDFSWLDEQVDSLRKRSLIPWLCLCYGNVLYDPLAGDYQGAVGCPPIRTQAAYEAWLRYCEATAAHFAGRIEYYEVWNEAEGGWTWRPQPNASEYADFCLKTAAAVKRADKNAKIITGSHYEDSLAFFNEEFAGGTLAVSDAITYHSYHYDERMSMQRARALRQLLNRRGSNAEIIQGESGSQSRTGGNGALFWIRTDPMMQAKQLLRHTVADLLCGVKFSSVFSCVDMAEDLDAKEGKPIATCGYFGLLGADFDPNTGKLLGDYTEKPSYYAFQNLCALFPALTEPVDLPVLFTPGSSSRLNGFDCPTKDLLYGALQLPNNTVAFAYWNATDLITVKGYDGSVTLEISGVPGTVRLLDPMDGSIYRIPDSILTETDHGTRKFCNLPIKDYPLFLVFEEVAK